MTYKALYRTYRPKSFDDVAGQKHIVKTLKNAILQNKIAHAYLFCGPRGTGKTSIAKIFAKAINCESDHKPCDICENCKAVLDGNHPDIIEIDAASNNGVDEVRELIEKVKYAPLKGKYKVYIIDEVHMMSAGAFNALLKTIEEPPEHVIFIFATTEPKKVLPTIISRCQRYDFTKVPTKDMENALKKVLENEKINYEENAISLIAQLADGGMRDASSILDQVIAYSVDKVSVKEVNDIYGIVTITELINLLELIVHKDCKQMMNTVSTYVDQGIDIKRTTMNLIEILKETVIFDYSKDESLLKLCKLDQIKLLLSEKTSNERLKMIDVLMDAYDKYRFSANIGSYFEVCLLNMMEIKEKNVSRETFEIDDEPIPSIVSGNRMDKSEIKKTIPKIESKITDDLKLDEIKPIGEELNQEKTKEKVVSKVKTLKTEFLLSLLVAATKTLKQQDMVLLNHIDRYLRDPEWAKYANLFRNHKLVASGEKHILVAVDNQSIANEINEKDEKSMFFKFMNEILGVKKKVFAISIESEKDLICEFVKRNKARTLPPAVNFEIIDNEVEKKESTELEIIEGLFGKENIEILED